MAFAVERIETVQFKVGDQLFTIEKDAKKYVAFLNFKQLVTDYDYYSIEEVMQNNPTRFLSDYTIYKNAINALDVVVVSQETFNPREGVKWSWEEFNIELDYFLSRNQKIYAIKLVRECFSCGLKEAKDWVEAEIARREVAKTASLIHSINRTNDPTY